MELLSAKLLPAADLVTCGKTSPFFFDFVESFQAVKVFGDAGTQN
jgi:hypothetical protein